MTTEAAILEIGLVLLLAVAAGAFARRLHLPAVIGYLAVGLVVSPFTPGYVADREHLELLAGVGVVLLLFEVGLEIDVLRLARERGRMLWAAPLQVAITTALASAGAWALGLSPTAALVVGVSIAMSSSVVVVNITRSRRRTTNRETDAALLGWSLLQDLTGIAAALLLLAFTGLSGRPPAQALLEIAGFGAISVVFAWLLPRVLSRLHAEHDLFLLVSVGSGLGLAGLGATAFGVPLGLAAFVAGLAVGESPAAAEARRRILPFRDLFAVVFFVLLGSLIDPARLMAGASWVAFALVAVVAGKALPTWVLARLLRLDGVRPLQLAVGLGQVGEFSFVLATLLVQRGIVGGAVYTGLLTSVVLTIAASTLLVRLGGQPRAAVTAGG